MNVFHKVTLESLKKNKTRTVVTVIGIMLSAAMICAVTTCVSSLQNYTLQNTIYREGNWHGSALSADETMRNSICSDERVEAAVCSQQLGYAKLEGCNNEYKPYLYVMGTGDGFEDMMPVHITAGEYPKTPNEILLPEHLANNGGVVYKIGDVITLALGDRTVEDGILNQQNPLIYDTVTVDQTPQPGDEPGSENVTSQDVEIQVIETLEIRESRTYIVVGFYERPQFEDYSAPGYTAITVADKEPGENAVYDIYFRMKNSQDIYDFMEELGISGTRNNEVLILSGSFRYGSFYSVLWGLAAIVIALILFGSVSLIYNAFSISVSERTKQFGLLSSIGATKKQLRKMVFFEAMAVSVIGIPLGILAGIGGIGVTLMIIGNRFSALYGYNIPMRVSVSLASVVIAVLVALITVLISAWIPSKRAMKVSAVEAIRQNNDIKTKNKDVRTPKIVYKLFGLPGMLANKHYKRNRKKYRTTVVSLFMSIVLFVSASAFSDYLRLSAEGGLEGIAYDLSYDVHPKNFEETSPEALLEELQKGEHVTAAMFSVQRFNSGTAKTGIFSESYREEIADEDGNVPEEWVFYFYEYYIPDAEFKRILNQNGLKEADYFNSESPLALAVDGERGFDTTQGKYISIRTLAGDGCSFVTEKLAEISGYYNSGYEYREDGTRLFHYTNNEDETDTIKIPESEVVTETVLRAEKTITDRPYYLSTTNVLMLYPVSMVSVLHPEETDLYYHFYFQTDDHAAAFTSVQEILVSNGFASNSLYDCEEQNENNGNIIAIIEVFSYGFIVLISLIAAANVFNTISTNIALRRREFAMLKSVGMTGRGFNRMMCFECILYGTKSLLWGLPVSVGVTFLIHLAVNQGFETTFRLPWNAIGIAVMSVFAVVFATMMYAMNKIKKDNPIEALKNENL